MTAAVEVNAADLVLAETEPGLGPPELERLHERADAYASKALADATLRAYAREWRRFVRFCARCETAPLPADPAVVRLYLAAMADEGRRPAGIDLALAAIGYAHTRHGFSPPRKDRSVAEVRRGIRKILGTAPNPKAALTVEQLRALVDAWPDTALGARDRAIALLGWIGAFRPSELASLFLDDLEQTPKGIEVRVRRSKTDQEGEGRFKTIPRGAHAETCPVHAVLLWLERRGTAPGPLFFSARFGRLGTRPIQRQDVARILKRGCLRAGLEPADIAGASLRSGFVTAAIDAGKLLPSIMAQTWHKRLDTLVRYVRPSALRASAAEGLGL